jgi:hypothetical protein
MRQQRSDFRSLVVLEGSASSSRVLNLCRLTQMLDREHGPGGYAPFFRNRDLNLGILLKSRLQGGEVYLFPDKRYNATKIILPYDVTNLREGGKAKFVGQSNTERILYDHLGLDALGSDEDVRHDLALLDLLDGLPTLDPFLLREKLRAHGFAPDPGYFRLSPKEFRNIRRFVLEEFAPLAQKAFPDFNASEGKANAIVEKIWEASDTETLRPLLAALRIDESEAPELLFVWKGIVYYKYLDRASTADLQFILRFLTRTRVFGVRDAEDKAALDEMTAQIVDKLKRNYRILKQRIAEYDHAYHTAFIRDDDVAPFRRFLDDARQSFDEMGAIVAGVCHSAAYWRFRHGKEDSGVVHADEMFEVLSDLQDATAGT